VDPAVLERLGIAGPVAAFEVDLSLLLGGERSERRIRPLSRFPASSIDLAVVVDDAVAAGAVAATLRAAGGELCESVHLFDVFRAEAIGPGRRSLAFALRFRAPDRTLTDAEVATLRQSCIDAVAATHGATLRA
ncbi:MAG: phenylalanine--tRNA ligase subunit beta, partial [Acidimicrobiia bacterium]